MKPVDDFVVALVDELPAGAVQASGEGIGVAGFTFALPIEAQLDGAGGLLVSLPRGRLATGFDIPHGRIGVTYERGE